MGWQTFISELADLNNYLAIHYSYVLSDLLQL
jgi:hypothetical protein